MHSQIQRHLKLGQYVGEAVRSTNGILQGCPISVMLLNAVVLVLHRSIGREVTAESFVDHLTLLSPELPALQATVYTVADFITLTDQQVNTKKTKSFAMYPGPDLIFEGKAFERP